jgi:hypothetical protein
VEYVGGPAIWTAVTGLFTPFSKIEMENQRTLVVSRPDGTHAVQCETIAQLWLKGAGEKISVPSSKVFTLGKAEWDGSEGNGEAGFEGLQILDARLYHDRSVLPQCPRKSEQEVETVGVDA